MLKLPNVTLLAIDVADPGKTLEALLYTLRYVEFGDVVLATDLERHQTLPDRFPMRLHPIKEADNKEQGSIRSYFKDYERHQITLPAEIVRTDFVLCQEWDSAVLNPLAWDNSWLALDYIGAFWPPYYDPGWPPTMSGYNVGNGGFSLRSKRFCDLVRKAAMTWPDDPALMSYDCWMCRTMRPWLETNGVRFASEEQALKFSCEDAVIPVNLVFMAKRLLR
jgi:hypothetical protein